MLPQAISSTTEQVSWAPRCTLRRPLRATSTSSTWLPLQFPPPPPSPPRCRVGECMSSTIGSVNLHDTFKAVDRNIEAEFVDSQRGLLDGHPTLWELVLTGNASSIEGGKTVLSPMQANKQLVFSACVLPEGSLASSSLAPRFGPMHSNLEGAH